MTNSSRHLSKILSWGLLVAVLVAPTQYGFQVIEKATLSIVDPILWGLFGVLCLQVLLTRRFDLLKPPPLIAVVVLTDTDDTNEGIRAAYSSIVVMRR